MIKLENKCGFYTASRQQRETEIARDEGKKGTMGFQERGCYDCDGNNRECETYFNPFEEYMKGLGKTIK